MAAGLLPMFGGSIMRVFMPMMPILMVFLVTLAAAWKRRANGADRVRKFQAFRFGTNFRVEFGASSAKRVKSTQLPIEFPV
jgi:tetrahydromethanopterin S-methyltransferase subunit C